MKQNTAYTDLRSWWRKHKVSKLIWTVTTIIPYVVVLLYVDNDPWPSNPERIWPPLNNSEHGGSYINITYYRNYTIMR